jgi:hypothetical protein
MSTGGGFERSAFCHPGGACGQVPALRRPVRASTSAAVLRVLDVALTRFWRKMCGGTGADFMNPADSRFVVRGFAFLKRQALGAKEKAHDDGR